MIGEQYLNNIISMEITFPQDAARLHQLALNSLEISAEEFQITTCTGHSPPPAVIALQEELCSPTGNLDSYFHFAILPQGGFQDFRIDAEHFLLLVEKDNEKIIKATRDHLAIVPYEYGVDETSFTFPRALLRRLLPVARRAWDLLIDEGGQRGSAEQQYAYRQLRVLTENFIRQFKYPSSLRNSLLLALEWIPDTWEDDLWPVMSGTVLDPTRVIHRGVNMEVVQVFSNRMILLKSISGDLIFDIVAEREFPSVVCNWERHHLGLKDPGDIALWINKGRDDCIITGFATSRNGKMSIVRLMSKTGDIEEDWWLEEESLRKFGDGFRSVIFQHRRRTGQLGRENHEWSLRNQMDMVYQERSGDY